MKSFWTFLNDEKNQQTLRWLGGGGVVAAGGIWAVVTFFWPHHDAAPTPPAGPASVQAGNCSIASAGSSSGNSINCGPAPAGRP